MFDCHQTVVRPAKETLDLHGLVCLEPEACLRVHVVTIIDLVQKAAPSSAKTPSF